MKEKISERKEQNEDKDKEFINNQDTPIFPKTTTEKNIFDLEENKTTLKEEESDFLKVPQKTEKQEVKKTTQNSENVLFNEDAILFTLVDNKWKKNEQGSVAIVEEEGKKKYVFYVPSLGCMRHNFYVDFDMFGKVEKENVILVLPGSDSVATTCLLKFRNAEFAEKFKNLIDLK